MTDEQLARRNAAIKAAWASPDVRARQSVAKTGIKESPETRAKISVAHMGMKASPEMLLKMSAASKESMNRPEVRAKNSAAHMGRIESPEWKAKVSVALTGRPVSPETRAKIGAIHWKGGPQISNRKQNSRRRTYGFVPLNDLFAGCEGHHVDAEQVIYMPKALHHSIWHRQSDGRGMAAINAVAYNFLFKQEVEAAFEALDARAA